MPAPSPFLALPGAHAPLSLLYQALNYPLFSLGVNQLTLAVLLKLFALCGLVILAERIIRRNFTVRLLKQVGFDAALQYAIARIGGYVFITFGFYLALTAVGLPLNSLAVVAGAIGIGIGFGLQNVIQNFVSGIIILAERPIAIGDRIEVGGVAGTVSRINLRATEVVSNDNITTIVPNSNFITSHVTNWSHGDPRVQIRIPVGVAYGSDIEKVKRLLQEVGAENTNTLKSPAPNVYFEAFGESALNFELGVWTETMTHSPRKYRSEINFAIERKFRENEIEIPFPQRDLRLRAGTFTLAPEPKEPDGPNG